MRNQRASTDKEEKSVLRDKVTNIAGPIETLVCGIYSCLTGVTDSSIFGTRIYGNVTLT